MVKICPNCGIQNEDNAKYCFYCGVDLTQNNKIENIETLKGKGEIGNPRYAVKSSKWDTFILMLDFSAIGKGLLIGLLIGLVTAGFIGIFFGSMITGYYMNNRRIKYLSINGWVLGFISMIIWAILSFLIPSSTLIKSFVDAQSIIGSTGLTIILALIFWLVLWAIVALLGSIGAIIGSKISKRRNKKFQLTGD